METKTIVALAVFAILIALMAYIGLASKGKRGGSVDDIVNENATIRELTDYDAGIADVLLGYGLHCVGCGAAQGERLWQACNVHGLDTDEVLASIKAYLAKK